MIPESNERKSDEETMSRARKSPGVVDRKLAEGGGSSGGVVCCQSEKAKAVEACKCAIDQVVSSPKPLENRDGAWLIPNLSRSFSLPEDRQDRIGRDRKVIGQVVDRVKERVTLNFRSVL